ncbi:MAG: hypothetical protein ACLQU2_07695 [Candidatus Binataceae bacterium]
MTVDMDKARAELPILQDFIDFVNNQVGVYMDCLAGFEGNTVRIHRQIARVQRPVGRQIKDGQPVIVYASVEDPGSPDVIHHRIVRAEEFLIVNAEAGFNEQQVCWSIIVFLFAYWDEEVRPRIAAVRGIQSNEVRVDALGDLRLLRNSIIHNKGVVSPADHASLKKMASLVKPGQKITLDHAQVHMLFVTIKQAIAEIILHYTGQFPGAPDASEIVSIAIQNAGPRKNS